MQSKTCIRCSMEKPIELFHKNARMRGGRLNKCSACVIEYVAEWRLKNPAARKSEYMNGLGAKRRARGLKYVPGLGPNQDPEARRLSALKYQSKRRVQTLGRPTFEGELDQLAMAEARDLCVRRLALTGRKWSIDHIVPLNAKFASGLHNAFNIQVAPSAWNSSKGNRNMRRYFGGKVDAA